ncbi:glutamate racemase [Uliginosibacterium sp. 31-16]|uniref:glutamate racemase n=1 Tax=Uliginosibacterium sp. 31-16 TaxID=3068315 RepID=UPI00273FCC47|nr:glutamate racemase [Uliginosibacterium sp. 31-16]MDP5240612.1 glutamate racemase [Uliginosibacterium sp. 31-16]
MSDPRPIGVFDSGVGGLSVLREIRALLPAEDLLYCADSGHAPYGEKPQHLIAARSLELSGFLLEQGAKALVIACNTATAAAAQAIRAQWPDVPVIGMEPAVKPATAATRNGVVGVLATTGTLESARFAALLDQFGKGVKVLTRPGTGLVEAVERGEQGSVRLFSLLKAHLEPLLAGGADVVVLGCTHYVFLREQVEAIVGPSVQVIDTGAAVATQVQRKLQGREWLASPSRVGCEQFWASGELSAVERTMRLLWPGFSGGKVLPASDCMSSFTEKSS